MEKQIRLYGDRILLKTQEETKTASGVVVVKKNEPGSLNKGTVLVVGPGRITDYGEFIPIGVEVGQEVLFSFGESVVIEGETYQMVREPDVALAFVK